MTNVAGFRWDLDARDVVTAKARAAAAAALQDAGEFLLEVANRTAPIEEGVLIGSGHVSTSRAGSNASAARITTVVAYDTPYAVRQHEDTRLRHDSGRRAKWLEHTFREQASKVAEFLADRMRKAID